MAQHYRRQSLFQVREGGKSVKSFYETKGYQVDSTFFDLFSYQFTEGSAHTALTDQHSVVLSEEIAHKLFGNASALNRLIRIGGTSGNGEDFKVTGVYRDESARSHIDAKFFLPIYAGWVGGYLRTAKLDFCCNNMFVTYLKLRPGTDPEQLQKKFPAFMKKYASNDLKAVASIKSYFWSRFQTCISPTS